MSEAADLSHRSISAALWVASGSAVLLTLQFGIQVILARLLGPEQYGLFAMAAVVILLSSFFTISLAYGLIQKRTVTDEDVRFVNCWQLSVGAAVAIAVFLLADPAAGFFNEPRVAPLIRAMSIVCLLQAAAGPSANLLNRDLDFKSIYLAGIASYAVGYVLVGIPLAISGYGVNALVMAFITQTLLNLALLYGCKRHVLGFVIWHRDAHALWTYGFTVFATNINNWVLVHLSRVVVGRMFPSAAVGLYAMPYNLVMQLAGAVMGTVRPPLFTASSRVQDDVARLRTVFLKMLAATTLLAAPIFVGITTAACIALDVRARDIATAFRAGVAVTMLVAGAIALVDGLALRMTGERPVVLALDVATGAVTQVMALRLFRPWFSLEVLSLFEMLLARLPRSLAPFGESILLAR